MGFSLEDYDIVAQIGCGAFGTVLRARQRSLDRTVAIKRLSPHRTQDRESIARFRREARAMAALSHDNIVSIFDYAFHDGNYYIVMEYIEGGTFEAVLDSPATPGEQLAVLERVARALVCAHEHGIVHRDVKPSNILIGADRRVKLTDFGLASFSGSSLSLSGDATVGTILYMSPEALVSPRDVDARADIYALGCLIYRVLSKRLPFEGTTMAQVSWALLNEPPPPVSTTPAFEPLAALAQQCLNKERDRRPSLAQVLEQIGALSASRESVPPALLHRTPRRTPRRPLRARLSLTGHLVYRLSAALTLAGALLALVFVLRPAPRSERPLPPGYEAAGSGPVVFPAPGNEDPGAPLPLVERDMPPGSATVVVRGMHPGDSLYINDVFAPSPGDGVRLAPGRYWLVVTSPQGTRRTRAVDILPYQVFDWDLGTRQGAHHD